MSTSKLKSRHTCSLISAFRLLAFQWKHIPLDIVTFVYVCMCVCLHMHICTHLI